MRDPRGILARARQGATGPGWAVFTKRRGRIGGFLKGTSGDPDPMLVITPEGVVEFVDDRRGMQVVDFDQLADVTLRVRGSSFSDSMIVRLEVWIDLRWRDGRTQKWQSSSFSDDYGTVQGVLEAYGAYKMMRGIR